MAGVDVGGTKILGGAVDEAGVVLRRVRVDTPAGEATAEDVREAIAAVVRDLAAGHPIERVGVGTAGFVNAARSMVMFAPHLPWRREPLKDELEKLLDLPVVIENDANAAIWAEARFGAAKGAADIIGVTLGTGLGGAVILGGHLVRGANGMAAEFGHVCAVPNGDLCHCGLRGCLELYTSGSALTRWGRQLVDKEGGGGLLHEMAEGDPVRVTGPMVTKAARAGDDRARGLFRDLGGWLGLGLANLAASLDPDFVVVGGGLVEVADLFMDRARESFEENLTAGDYREMPTICPAALGQDAGFLGAADLAVSGG
jgi:glucokinase